MIYTCRARYCHFVFSGSKEQTTCPDCGKKSIRPATRSEREAFIRHASPVPHRDKRSG